MSVVHTIGHSTRMIEELVACLTEASVEAVADVRRFPSSRRHPQFNRPEFAAALAAHEIDYVWLGESLGGRRREIVPVEQSPNRAWKVGAFRNYADAMATPDFQAGVEELERIACERRTAFLCAEKLWWQCHRRLLADLLVVRGWTVVHLIEPARASEHRLSEWARVDDGRLTYPGLV